MTDLLDKACALEAQLRADDATMSPRPFAVRNRQGHLTHQHDAWHTVDDATGRAVIGSVYTDLRWSEWHSTATGIARTRNALPAIADTLRDLRSEIERYQADVDFERNRANYLAAEVAAMRPVVEAAERWKVFGPVNAGIGVAINAYRARKP